MDRLVPIGEVNCSCAKHKGTLDEWDYSAIPSLLRRWMKA